MPDELLRQCGDRVAEMCDCWKEPRILRVSGVGRLKIGAHGCLYVCRVSDGVVASLTNGLASIRRASLITDCHAGERPHSRVAIVQSNSIKHTRDAGTDSKTGRTCSCQPSSEDVREIGQLLGETVTMVVKGAPCQGGSKKANEHEVWGTANCSHWS